MRYALRNIRYAIKDRNEVLQKDIEDGKICGINL